MAEIGALLRETRMRKRIDISEIEAETKIRARYLRALENEEWDLLPGPTFVKTFLRTYADYLELDSRSLVEDYKHRFEPAVGEPLAPFAAGRGPRRERRRRLRPRVSPLLIGVLVFAALIGILFVVGTIGDDDGGEEPAGAPPPAATSQPTSDDDAAAERRRRRAAQRERRERAERRRRAAARRTLRLQFVASAPVSVCLVDSRGRKVIDGETLDPATQRKTYRSRSFRAWFGNGSVEVRVVGARTLDVPDRPNVAGYRVSRERLRLLTAESPCT